MPEEDDGFDDFADQPTSIEASNKVQQAPIATPKVQEPTKENVKTKDPNKINTLFDLHPTI